MHQCMLCNCTNMLMITYLYEHMRMHARPHTLPHTYTHICNQITQLVRGSVTQLLISTHCPMLHDDTDHSPNPVHTLKCKIICQRHGIRKFELFTFHNGGQIILTEKFKKFRSNSSMVYMAHIVLLIRIYYYSQNIHLHLWKNPGTWHDKY